MGVRKTPSRVYLRLNAYIEANNIDKHKAFSAAGFSGSQTVMILKGKRSLQIEEYIRICEVLKVPVDKFTAD